MIIYILPCDHVDTSLTSAGIHVAYVTSAKGKGKERERERERGGGGGSGGTSLPPLPVPPFPFSLPPFPFPFTLATQASIHDSTLTVPVQSKRLGRVIYYFFIERDTA